MRGSCVCLIIVCCLLLSCREESNTVDGLKRAHADALNKASFALRFNDSRRAEQCARQALDYISDSLPEYDDGRLRAWNNMATACYNHAAHDMAERYADSVLQYKGRCHNRQVERMLAQLLRARLLQRQCDIAGSYRILYELENMGLLNSKSQDLLHCLAQSEFYITTTTLNYHYRNKSQYQQAELLTAMEERRHGLRCDWQEDMSLNYALAYGYYSLCTDTTHQSPYLGKALRYCMENFVILADSLRFSTYHLANTYQLLGFMLWSHNVKGETWHDNADQLSAICSFVDDAFGFSASVGEPLLTTDSSPDGVCGEESTQNEQLAFAFLREATALFFLHDDPYQRLGAIVSTGRYCMAHGDTALARDYFFEALADSTMLGVAPKFEAMLYEGFLTSGCASSLGEVSAWTSHELDLLNKIKQNESADFALQQQLEKARGSSFTYRLFAIVLAALMLMLLLTMLLLRRRSKALQRETQQLQEAKRKDVERIANVETCLSVLRHDITPFVSYLQNENMPESLRREVTSQLLRTFDNIKNWTNLSIPSGLQFRGMMVPLQEVFDSVKHSVNNFHGEKVSLVFQPTTLWVYGDKQLVEIMLRNLVNNALQHTEKGSVQVSASADKDDADFVCVSVSDTGCGITPDEQEDLFRVDKKIKNDATTGYGTGFGLILCRYIVKKHDDNTRRGCRIWVESEPGKGSSFCFRLALKC